MKRTKGAREFLSKVGANVKRERERRRLSQEELGGKIGADHAGVSRTESGKRDIKLSTLYEFARALGTTPSDLVDVEG